MIDKALFSFPKIKSLLGLLAGLSALQALFVIGQAFGLALSVSGLWSGQNLSQQISWLVLFALSYSGRHVVTFFRDHLLERYAAEQAGTLRQELLQKIFRVGPRIVQAQGTGNTATTVLDGIDQVESYLQLLLPKLTNMLIMPLLIVIAVFILDWRSGVVLTLVFPLIILFMIILGYAAKSKADKQYRSYQTLSNHFIDSLRGIDTLKYFGLSKTYSHSIFQSSEGFRFATMATLKVAILSTFALDFFTTLSVAVVAVLLGLRLINGAILLLPALTVLILAPEYFLPIRDFSNDYHATLDGKNALASVQAILGQAEVKTAQIPLSAWSASTRLSVQAAEYAADGKQLLTDISFTAKGFEKIGIIGMSGAGKSTLISLLSGFFKLKAGTITINGQKIADFSQTDWQKQLIYIPQNPYIFRMTLRENIAFYQPEAEESAILQALTVAGLESLVAELADGLDTMLGEGARTLSGGQAQRVALARAFLDQERRILLFDEPTAHLDIETEVELKERMLPLMKDRLVFFATHRMHWMKEMDQILVLEDGQLLEQGSLAALSASNGAFTALTRQIREERTP